MKTVKLTNAEVNDLDPNHIVVATALSEQNVTSGAELIPMYKQDGPWDGQQEPTVADAIGWFLNEMSGNNFEILAFREGDETGPPLGEIVKVRMDWK